MPAEEIVSVDALAEAYRQLGSVYAVGRRFGIHGSSVHERLMRHRPGLVKPPNRWTRQEVSELSRVYVDHATAGTLDILAKQLNRTKSLICRKARELGLTDKHRKRPYLSVWLDMPETTAAKIWAEFKASSLGLIAWCKKRGYDDLGFSRTMKQFFGDEWESVIESKQPLEGLYRRGRRLEYTVRDHLRKVGFFAQRSPASKSPIDILAVRPGEVWMVQCKRNGALGVGEWNELFKVAKAHGAVPVLATMETGRGSLAYYVLLMPKDGSRRAQPMTRVYPTP